MKTILALRGAGNRGKSTTLCLLIGLIRKSYPNAIFEETRYKIDITIVITIDKTRVGIETQGDPNSRLQVSLQRFIKVKCKVVICACRSSGRTVEIVREAANDGYQIKWFDKGQTQDLNEQAAANLRTAKELFAVFKQAIDA